MRMKLVVSMLVLAVAAFGVAPCAAMGTGGARSMGDHCTGDVGSGGADEPSGPMPAPQDCCAVGSMPDRQLPTERTETAPVAASAPDMAPLVWLQAPGPQTAPSPTSISPPRSGVPLRLLFSIFLI